MHKIDTRKAGPASLTTEALTECVLVVDDDPQVIRVLLRIMGERYTVKTAMTIQEAVDGAVAFSPAFVLLDVHLSFPSKGDGLSCLTALRNNGYSKPVFMLSSDTSFDLVHEAARLGANGYLSKCDPSRFMDRLSTLLEENAEDTPRARHSLPPQATAYLETRGLSGGDIALLRALSHGIDRETDIARALNTDEARVRDRFQQIRNRLGAKSQSDLARILGVLSCFSPVCGASGSSEVSDS